MLVDDSSAVFLLPPFDDRRAPGFLVAGFSSSAERFSGPRLPKNDSIFDRDSFLVSFGLELDGRLLETWCESSAPSSSWIM